MESRSYRAQTSHTSADDGGKKARSPGRARHKLLKRLRAGMPGDSGVLVVTRVRSTNTKCTRGRGCSGHPAFPTPSLGAKRPCTARVLRAARGKVASGIALLFEKLKWVCAVCEALLSLLHKTHLSSPHLIRPPLTLRKQTLSQTLTP